jgi:mannose-1-phosphate guanylyltransferase
LKAVILAGGFGTRLRPLSCTRPKILFPILNKPLLQWTFERLAKNNIKEAIMAVNYQTEVAIKQHRIPRCGVHVTFSRDPLRKPLGTGGPIKKVEKSLGHNEPFLVLNGDIFADVNYAEILKLHERKDAMATIALHEVEDPSRYGVAELAEDSRIRRFIEKPAREEAPTNLINAGAYVLSPEIFKYIPEGRTVSLEREVFTKLAEESRLYGYVYRDLWTDIGKPEDYLAINRVLLDTRPPEAGAGKLTQIKPPVALDKNVRIGKGSTIGPHTVLGRNIAIGENVKIQDSIVLRETEISKCASVEGAIVGEGVFIGENAKIGKGCILGDHVRIRANAHLAQNVWVCPAKEVAESVLAPRNIV